MEGYRALKFRGCNLLLLSRRILRSKKGTDLAKVTWHAAALTPPPPQPPSAVSRFPLVCDGQMGDQTSGHLLGAREGIKLKKTSFYFVPCCS